MNKLVQFQNKLTKGNKEQDLVRTLYIVMCKVGGYEQLLKLSYSSLNEIIKCIEWENKEMNKSNRRKR